MFVRGHAEEDLPSERTMRDILNRMNYRLKRIQKGKPLKKTPETDAIFANVRQVRDEVRDDPKALEKKWNGVLLNGLKVVLQCALRMRWKGRHPSVKRLAGEYPDGVRVPAKEMKQIEARLDRSTTLPKYDITITPRTTEPAVK